MLLRFPDFELLIAETDKFRVGEVGEPTILTAWGYIGRENLNSTEDDIDLYRHRDSRMSA